MNSGHLKDALRTSVGTTPRLPCANKAIDEETDRDEYPGSYTAEFIFKNLMPTSVVNFRDSKPLYHIPARTADGQIVKGWYHF